MQFNIAVPWPQNLFMKTLPEYPQHRLLPLTAVPLKMTAAHHVNGSAALTEADCLHSLNASNLVEQDSFTKPFCSVNKQLHLCF